jgi:hypothetical protein
VTIFGLVIALVRVGDDGNLKFYIAAQGKSCDLLSFIVVLQFTTFISWRRRRRFTFSLILRVIHDLQLIFDGVVALDLQFSISFTESEDYNLHLSALPSRTWTFIRLKLTISTSPIQDCCI